MQTKKTFALLLLILLPFLFFSGCSASQGITVRVAGRDYDLNVPGNTDTVFSNGVLKVTVRDTRDVMLDLSALEGCEDIDRIEILSLGEAAIVLPDLPHLLCVAIYCENIGHLDCISLPADTSLIISGTVHELTAKYPLNIQFTGTTDLGGIHSYAVFGSLALDRPADLSPLTSFNVRSLTLTGPSWELDKLSGNTTVTELFIHRWKDPDLSFIAKTQIRYLDVGICEDISALSGTELTTLVIRDGCVSDAAPISGMRDLKNLVIWIDPTAVPALTVTSENAAELNDVPLSLDRRVLADFVEMGGSITFMPLIDGM